MLKRLSFQRDTIKILQACKCGAVLQREEITENSKLHILCPVCLLNTALPQSGNERQLNRIVDSSVITDSKVTDSRVADRKLQNRKADS